MKKEAEHVCLLPNPIGYSFFVSAALRRGWDKSILTKVNCEQYRYGNILRLSSLSFAFFYDNIFVLSQP